MDVVLAPAPRMEFRGLEENMLKPGVTVSVVAYPSKQIKDEFRAETITVGTRVTELRGGEKDSLKSERSPLLARRGGAKRRGGGSINLFKDLDPPPRPLH